jgi:seryl-tRNA synthetase
MENEAAKCEIKCVTAGTKNLRRKIMIELALLASGLVSVVTPFLVKGAETLASEAAKEGWAERGKIWEKIKSLFHGDNQIITLFEAAPDSKKVQDQVTAKLEEKLKEAPEAATELEEMWKSLPQQVKTNTINQSGDGNVAMQDTQGSTININK